MNSAHIPVNYHEYRFSDEPFLRHFHTSAQGGDTFFTRKWGCIIIDEGHNYFNVKTTRCKAIASICAQHRWVTTGTLLDEPIPERVLGYFLMINFQKYPRNLPDLEIMIRTSRFKGIFETMVCRHENTMITEQSKPILHKHVVSHNLSENERIVYGMLKSILKILRNEVRRHKIDQNTTMVRKFSSYLLAMITYTRTFLICPMITISTIYLDTLDFDNKSDLTRIMQHELNRFNLYPWLNNEASVVSTRMKEIFKIIDKHPDERIVLFSSFRTSIDVLKHYIMKHRPVYEILPKYDSRKRGESIKDFDKSKNGVLMLSYALGSDGLNLQSASVCMICDFWWNASKTKQSIARINRFGQLAKEINIYLFNSNTGIEKVLFEKHKDKLDVADEILHGHQTSTIKQLKIEQVLRLIECDEYRSTFNKVI